MDIFEGPLFSLPQLPLQCCSENRKGGGSKKYKVTEFIIGKN